MVAPLNNYLDVLGKKKDELEQKENTKTYPKSIKLGAHTVDIGDLINPEHNLILKKIIKKRGGISFNIGYPNKKEGDFEINLLETKIKGDKTETWWNQEGDNTFGILFPNDKEDQSIPEKQKKPIEKTETLEEKIKRIETEVKIEREKLEKVNARIKEIEEQLKNLLKKPKEKKESIIEETPTSTVNDIFIDEKLNEIIKSENFEEEMENSTPENFEPEEVKTDKNLFLKNSLVKSVSGMNLKISENLKKITKKIKSKALLGVAILGLFTGTSGDNKKTSYVVPNKNIDNSKNTVSIINKEKLEEKNLQKYLSAFHIKDFTQLEQIKKDIGIKEFNQIEKITNNIDTSLYNKLTPEARKIYLYCLTNIDHTYYIVDKPTATIYAINSNGKGIASSPVILGATKGEIPNTADTEKPLYNQIATTPAGKFELIHSDIDSTIYKGKSLALLGTDYLAIHIVYPDPEEYKKRIKALKTSTPNDNRISWGCINVSENFWTSSIAPYAKNGSTIFITPDYQSTTTLDPSTGKIERTNANNTKINYEYKKI